MDDKPKPRPNRAGIYAAGTYALIAAALYGLTAYLSWKHPDDGLQWLPFMLLASPWVEINQNFLIFGLIVNTIFLWAIVTAHRNYPAWRIHEEVET